MEPARCGKCDVARRVSGARRATINAENAEEQRGAEQAPRVTRAGSQTRPTRFYRACESRPSSVHQPAEGGHHPWRLCVTLLPGVPCVLLFPAPSARRSLRRPAPHGWIQPPHAATATAFAPESGHADTKAPKHQCYCSEGTTLAVKDRSHAGRRAERRGDPVSAGCADRSQATSESQSDHIWRTATRLTNYFFASLE